MDSQRVIKNTAQPIVPCFDRSFSTELRSRKNKNSANISINIYFRLTLFIFLPVFQVNLIKKQMSDRVHQGIRTFPHRAIKLVSERSPVPFPLILLGRAERNLTVTGHSSLRIIIGDAAFKNGSKRYLDKETQWPCALR